MITGIVLAAGRSERMGRTKALLEVGGRSFLAAAVAALREGGCQGVVVVARGDEVGREAEGLGAVVVRNDAAEAEQIDSLRLGLGAAGPEPTGAVVLPVDHPLVRAETVRALIERHQEEPDAVVRPVAGDQPGHPTLFPRSTWTGLLQSPLPRGARTVVEAPETEVVDVPVDDPGILADIDTPAQYREHAGGAS